MAEEVVMPRLSDTMDNGTIARWLKREGDLVKKGEIIAEIETDKSNMELESYSSGILAKIVVQEGESAALGDPIALIASTEAEAGALNGGSQATSAVPQGDITGRQAEASSPQESGTREPAAAEAAKSPHDSPAGARVKASPLARRVAREQAIDLVDVVGTGPGGRITKDDVESFAYAGRAPSGVQRKGADAVPRTSIPSSSDAGDSRQPQPVEMSRMQQTIARRMTESRFSAPEFVLNVRVDMTESVGLLRSLKEAEDVPRVGPNDLLVRAAAVALRRHPDVNSGWENGTIVRYGRINVGNAVAVPGGLVAPVIRDADQKTLGSIAAESKDLIERARGNKLGPADYESGTFTISNLGMYGIEQFTPIINGPESCILGVGAIVPTPIAEAGQVVIREMMRLTMACDHRVVNGAQAAEFLRTLRRLLENPVLAVL